MPDIAEERDVSKDYYRMSQIKIISLIGCTITLCISVFGVALHVDRTEERSAFMNEKHEEQIRVLTNKIDFLQAQINQLKK